VWLPNLPKSCYYDSSTLMGSRVCSLSAGVFLANSHWFIYSTGRQASKSSTSELGQRSECRSAEHLQITLGTDHRRCTYGLVFVCTTRSTISIATYLLPPRLCSLPLSYAYGVHYAVECGITKLPNDDGRAGRWSEMIAAEIIRSVPLHVTRLLSPLLPPVG
jgi:hypothetical protein